MKHCPRCGQYKNADEFYRGQGYCTTCERNYSKQYELINRNRRKAYHREWYWRNHARLLVKRREYVSKHRDRIAFQERLHYWQNRERELAAARIWKQRNAERLRLTRRAWVSKRSERLWALATLHNHRRRFTVHLTTDELELLAKQTQTCDLCGTVLSYAQGTKKHIQNDSPTLDRINNDTNLTRGNVWIICARCNMTKSDLGLQAFIAYCHKVAQKFEVQIPCPSY